MLVKRFYEKARQVFLRRDGFGMNELLGIAAALIIAAFVILPGLQKFAGTVMAGLTDWWDHTIMNNIFPPS
jgi:hypothetical protein